MAPGLGVRVSPVVVGVRLAGAAVRQLHADHPRRRGSGGTVRRGRRAGCGCLGRCGSCWRAGFRQQYGVGVSRWTCRPVAQLAQWSDRVIVSGQAFRGTFRFRCPLLPVSRSTARACQVVHTVADVRISRQCGAPSGVSRVQISSRSVSGPGRHVPIGARTRARRPGPRQTRSHGPG